MKNPSENHDVFLGEQYKSFTALLDALPTNVLLMDDQNRVVYMNPMSHWLMDPLTGDLTGKTMPACQPGETYLTWRIPTPYGLVRFEYKVIPFSIDKRSFSVLVTINSDYPKSSNRGSEALFTHLFDQSSDGIVICDKDLIFIEWNREMERITGYSAREVIGVKLNDFLPSLSPDPRNPLKEEDVLSGHSPDTLDKVIKTGGSIELERDIVNRSGKRIWLHYFLFPVLFDNQVFLGASVRDISSTKEAQAKLKISENRFRTLVEAMGEGALALDLDLNIMFSNPIADSMYGAGPNFLTGKNIRDFIEPEGVPLLLQQVDRVKHGLSARYELDVSDFRGNPHMLRITSTPWRGANQEVIGSIIVFQDVTEEKIAEEHLRFTSTHDEVTDLYNRNYYEEEKARLKSGRRYPISIVIVDMDDLKTVNDTLGHKAGDELLRTFASIARRVFRTEDMIARIGGDEFAIFLPQTDRDAAREAVDRLKTATEKYNEEQPDHQLSFSIGKATAPSQEEFDEAIHRADYRMYRDKRQKKSKN